jgi:hypothetical protein
MYNMQIFWWANYTNSELHVSDRNCNLFKYASIGGVYKLQNMANNIQ